MSNLIEFDKETFLVMQFLILRYPFLKKGDDYAKDNIIKKQWLFNCQILILLNPPFFF